MTDDLDACASTVMTGYLNACASPVVTDDAYALQACGCMGRQWQQAW